jgi:hypothetical protein
MSTIAGTLITAITDRCPLAAISGSITFTPMKRATGMATWARPATTEEGNTRCPDIVGADDGSAVEMLCGVEEPAVHCSGLRA